MTIKNRELVLIKENKLPRNKMDIGGGRKTSLKKDGKVRAYILKIIINSYFKNVNRASEKLRSLKIRPIDSDDKPNEISYIGQVI